ncbi:hypothetical protein SeMB42_g00650 [Synchytrium endobioticum]|uniref:RING-type E3 ubiquitin transferase n=1 Tax=Synchytrium endobioticum TaxID=286115 RepID=A0A507DPM0_9FUNG|nr:hypothetical protein SeMB42_g00650 [Synchytrium endobioticum]
MSASEPAAMALTASGASGMTEDEDANFCRVCRAEATPDHPLYHPCRCSGSMKYIHQDCLEQWLAHSRKKHCEICNHQFTFSPIYVQTTPPPISVKFFVFVVAKRSLALLKTYTRIALSIVVWLIVLPYITSKIWRFFFSHTSLLSFIYWKLFQLVRNEISPAQTSAISTTLFDLEWITTSDKMQLLHHFFADVFEGQIIASVVIICAILIFAAKEWIVTQADVIAPEAVADRPVRPNPVPRLVIPPQPELIPANVARTLPRPMQNETPLSTVQNANESPSLRDPLVGESISIPTSSKVQPSITVSTNDPVDPDTNLLSTSQFKGKARDSSDDVDDYVNGIHNRVYSHDGLNSDSLASTRNRGKARENEPERPRAVGTSFLGVRPDLKWKRSRESTFDPSVVVPSPLPKSSSSSASRISFDASTASSSSNDQTPLHAPIPEPVGESHEPQAPVVRQVVPPEPIVAPVVIPHPLAGPAVNQAMEADLNDGNGAGDWNAFLELLGMWGPIEHLIQNISIVVVVLIFAIGVLAWAPYCTGRILFPLFATSLVKIKAMTLYLSAPIHNMADLLLEQAANSVANGVKWILKCEIASSLVKIAHIITPTSNAANSAVMSSLAVCLPRDLPAYWSCPIDSRSDDSISSGLNKSFLLARFGWWITEPRIGGLPETVVYLGFGYFVWLLHVVVLASQRGWLKHRYATTLFTLAGRVVSFLGVTVKFTAFMTVELGIFPIVCGILIDLCTLPVFDSTVQNRLAFHYSFPWTSSLLHWLVGTSYMFNFALYVATLRDIVRPGVMWFVRDPNDPSFHPINDIIEKPVLVQIKKLLIGSCMYAILIVGGVGSFVGLVGLLESVAPHASPFRIWPLKYESDGSISEFPLDRLIFHFVVPWAVRVVRPRSLFKMFVERPLRMSAKILRLSTFIFGGFHPDELMADGAERRFIRAPNHDHIEVVPGQPVMVYLEDHQEVQGRPNETPSEVSTNWVKIRIPNHFWGRLLFLSIMQWAFGLVASFCLMVGPIIVGRYATSYMYFVLNSDVDVAKIVNDSGRPELPVHDLHSFAVGVFLIVMIGRPMVTLVEAATWCLKESHRAARRARGVLVPAPASTGGTAQAVVDSAGPMEPVLPLSPPIAMEQVALEARWWEFDFDAGLRLAFTRQWNIAEWFRISGKAFFVSLTVGIVMPFLVGVNFDLYILSLIKSDKEQATTLSLLQVWALGAMHCKILYNLVIFGPETSFRRAVTAARDQGLVNLQLRPFAISVVLPVVGVGLALVLSPWLIVIPLEPRIIVSFNFEKHFEKVRLLYPVFALLLSLAITLRLFFKALKQWLTQIYEEECVIGRQLHNLEQEQDSNSQGRQAPNARWQHVGVRKNVAHVSAKGPTQALHFRKRSVDVHGRSIDIFWIEVGLTDRDPMGQHGKESQSAMSSSDSTTPSSQVRPVLSRTIAISESFRSTPGDSSPPCPELASATTPQHNQRASNVLVDARSNGTPSRSSADGSTTTDCHDLSLSADTRRLSIDDGRLLEEAKANMYVGRQNHSIRPTEDIFNANEPRIKEDIIRMIAQYLSDEGHQVSKLTVLDEATLKWHEREEQQADAKWLRKAILDGDWAEAEKLLSKPMLKNQKGFLYAMYKVQYLEYIEHNETQKAFTFLNKRLKPLEHLQTTPTEFRDLCYLLTAKAVTDVPSFKTWEGVGPARERLAEQFQNMLEFENADRQGSVFVPPHRLLDLLRQAVAYQIEFARYHPRIAPKVSTLLQDYSSVVIPNAMRHSFVGHTGNVKCVDFVGEDGKWIASGSSDNTVRIWELESATILSVLEGHASRIWDVTSSKGGARVASASGDGTVKIWDMKLSTRLCLQTLRGAVGDVYSVKFHPSGTHVATGGYDRAVRLYDLERGVAVKTFTGHQLSVSRTVFSPLGNLIVSGSKDSTIRFWDVVSGVCIRTITSHLGEVTSVEMSSNGREMLSSSKDNSNRLWDLRMTRPIRKFKGHQNTSKNFVRACFMGDALVVGGSEVGIVHLWDRDTGNILQSIPAHDGVAYSAVWNARQSLLVSCGDDNVVRSWHFDESRPLFDESVPSAVPW